MPSEIQNYRKGSETGKWMTFRRDGTKQVMGYSLNGKTVGDKYFFDSLGRLYGYNFFDLNDHVLAAYRYDTSGQVIDRGKNDFIIFDSIKVLKGKGNVDTFFTTLIVSHKPKTLMTSIKVENIGHANRILHSEDIDPKFPFNFYSNLVGDGIDSIKVIASRYDSTTGRSQHFIIVQPAR